VTSPEPLSCQALIELVTEYLEGALASDDRLALERHVAICPPCRGYFAQMRRTIEVGGAVPEEDLSPELRERMVEAFRGWKRERGDNRR